MLRVALKEYQSRIERLLEDNRLPEAAAHCHFLLQQYPRHIGTYRLFGRALLEQQLHNDAIDVFHRVASADPEDLIAHAGLAMAYQEKKELPMAIWHMERAFEVEPYNGAIREELRDLSARDGGKVRRGFELNGAALARIYFRGGLYGKAVTELRTLIEKFPDRLDLQVLLAETYYWEDRRLDAVNQSLHVLERLPYCIKANAILADLWLRGGRFSDAREHLSKLQSLILLTAAEVDPNTTVGRALSAHPDVTLPEEIVVDALDEVGPATAQFTYDTDWLQEIGVEGGVGSEALETTVVADTGIRLQRAEETALDGEEEEIDWLKDVVISIDEPATTLEEPLSDPVLDEAQSLEELDFEVEDAEIDISDDESELINDELIQLVEEQSEEINEFSDDLPSWSELATEEDQAEVDPGIGFAEADWLEQLEQVAPESELDDELPDWLYEAVGFTDELKMPSDYDLPDWLDEPANVPEEQADKSIGSVNMEFPEETFVSHSDLEEKNNDNPSSISADASDDLVIADQDSGEENPLPPPAWMIGNDDEADSFSDLPFDRSVDLGFDGVDDSIPWLDDFAAELGADQADETADTSTDGLTTEVQNDDDSA